MVLGMRSVLNTDMDTDTQTQTHRPTHTSFLHHFEKYTPPSLKENINQAANHLAQAISPTSCTSGV